VTVAGAQDHPNLNGIWQAANEAYWNIKAHAAAPGRFLQLGTADAVAPWAWWKTVHYRSVSGKK